jgi:hypothetical protein
MGRDLKIGGYTVGQSPNRPLWVALAGLVVAIIAGGTLEDIARAVFYVGLTVWAYEELVHGVNSFRRGLGAVALVLIVIGLARAFG